MVTLCSNGDVFPFVFIMLLGFVQLIILESVLFQHRLKLLAPLKSATDLIIIPNTACNEKLAQPSMAIIQKYYK